MDPPGFVKPAPQPFVLEEPSSDGSDLQRYEARAMEIARGQFGGIAQTAFTLWMFVGNQLAFFSIMFLFAFGMGPINNLLAMEKVFSPLSVPGARLLTAKAMYVGLNLVGLGVVLWKVRAMGLLPLTSADWVSLLPQRLPLQLAAAGAPA